MPNNTSTVRVSFLTSDQNKFGVWKLILWNIGLWIWLTIGSSSANVLPNSNTFYDPNQVQIIDLQISDHQLQKMKSALPRRIYVSATFQWSGQVIENVGVRYKGNSSSHPHQKHKRGFLIKFNEFEKGQSFLGLNRISLDNGIQFGSLFSERLITSILRQLGVKASRSNYSKLYLNGKYQGIYVNVERIDRVFIKNELADGGSLYKVDIFDRSSLWSANLGPLPPMEKTDSNPTAFEPKSKAANQQKTRDVIDLITKINETNDNDFARVIESIIDLDAFLKTMAVMLFSGAFDQLTGTNPHNYYLYCSPMNNRWHYIPWDLDVGFADKAFGYIPVIDGWNAAWPLIGGSPSPLIQRIVNDPKLLARYRTLANKILENYFHPDKLLPKVDLLYKQILTDLETDPFPSRRATNKQDQNYNDIVQSIKDFIYLRYKTARQQLDEPGDQPPLVPIRPPSHQQRGPKPGPPSANAPSNLHSVSISRSSVSLKWTDNATNEGAYILQRAEGESNQPFHNHIGQFSADITTAHDKQVVPGSIYRYRVYALCPSPSGPKGTGLSNTITIQIPSGFRD
ncbi:hypothetical protein CMK19_06075 [Candidatus Poribacteria bacterium]|nr:hypothetical protein [Candidatus Poribacteria bacterium]MEE2909134.1 CotH kinase family protein [Candidatus Poribacteria bacterium]